MAASGEYMMQLVHCRARGLPHICMAYNMGWTIRKYFVINIICKIQFAESLTWSAVRNESPSGEMFGIYTVSRSMNCECI